MQTFTVKKWVEFTELDGGEVYERKYLDWTKQLTNEEIDDARHEIDYDRGEWLQVVETGEIVEPSNNPVFKNIN